MQWIIKSDIGVVRSENQDRAAVFSNGEQTLAILCDGMGGHKGGSFASSIAIDTFEKAFYNYVDEDEIDSWIKSTISLCKNEMARFAKNDPELFDMGTTLTAALITSNKVFVFNVGDSRTYIYNDLLFQVTKDHNVRNYYIEKYNYSPEEAAKLIPAAALTYSLGPDKKTQVDTFIISIGYKTKYVILTSDGIHDYVTKPLFEQIIASKKSLETKSLDLIKAAIRGKSSDNLTVAIVELGE